MKKTERLKKVRFLPYFPYGLCSRYATTILGRANPYATRPWLTDNPEKLLEKAASARAAKMKRTSRMIEAGYISDKKRVCGTPPETRQFRALTKKGIATVLATMADLDEIYADNNLRDNDGNIKEITAIASGPSADLEAALFTYALSQNEADAQFFRNLLLEAVMHERTTPLTASLHLAHKAKVTTSQYSQNQVYSIWKYSHIQAMFLANNHLTYLDRRPYDTGFAIDGIHDDKSLQQYVQKNGLTMTAYTYQTFNAWYRSNPDFYRITQTTPTPGEEAREEWRHTPAFYKTTELPRSEDEPEADKGEPNYNTRRTPICLSHPSPARIHSLSPQTHTHPSSLLYPHPRRARIRSNPSIICRFC